MIQFLNTLIEWLAVLALSSIGIEYRPGDCPAAEPTEYRTVSIRYVDPAASAFPVGSAADGCASTSHSLQRIQVDIFMPPAPVSYDS